LPKSVTNIAVVNRSFHYWQIFTLESEANLC
jgi:hypothetical protein